MRGVDKMILSLQGISKSFDKKILFKDTTLEFEKGKIYGLLGRNGAGKTTLFNAIAQNIKLDQGEILLTNHEGSLTSYNNTAIGLIHTQPKLPDFMTGYEFVKFFMEINQIQIEINDTPESLLAMIGIKEEDQHLLLKDYSHGMQNKVQLLVTLMLKPPVLLLDEPLTSFDVVAAHDIKQLIKEAKKDSIIIFSTHILQLAQDMCDEIVLLHNKKLTLLPSDDLRHPDFEEEIIRLLSVEGDDPL